MAMAYTRILAVAALANGYAQAMLPDSSGLFMLDGKSDFDGNTFNAELGRWVGPAHGNAARSRRADDTDRLCDVIIVDKDTSQTNVKDWLEGRVYETQYGGDGKALLWPEQKWSTPRNTYLAHEAVEFTNGEAKKPIIYYLNHYDLWVVGSDKCVVTNSQRGCPIYAYWLDSGGAKFPQGLSPLRFWNHEAGQWQNDNQASTQCACPAGEWREDLKEKKCKKHTICKPGQSITQKASIRKDRKCKDCSDTEYSPKDNSEKCLARGQCTLGEYATTIGSKSNAFVCAACEKGFFTDKLNQAKCTEWKKCPVGQEQTAAGTTKTDRKCTICINGDTFKDAVGDGKCQECATCEDDKEFIAQKCVPGADTICKACPTCPDGEYLEGKCDAASTVPPVCKACHETCKTCGGKDDAKCHTCPFGHHLQTPFDHKRIEGGPNTFGECAKECAAGNYETEDADHVNQDQALVCKPCNDACGDDCLGPDANECLACDPSKESPFFILRRTAANKKAGKGGECVKPESCKRETYADYRNNECEPCQVCEEGATFEDRALTKNQCTADSDRECDPVAEPCALDEFQAFPPTLTSDRQCEACITCPAGTFTENNAGDSCAQSQAECKPCDGETEYTDQPGQTKCLEQDECDGGYDYACDDCQEPLPDQQGICAPCSDEQWDDDYDPLTPCVDKVKCKDYTSNDPNDGPQFISDPGSSSEDRVCDEMTFCTDDEFESQAATATSDRVCTAYKKCLFYDPVTKAGVEYEELPEGGRTGLENAKCKALDVCGGDFKFEVVAPTRLSNRECSNSETKFKNGTLLQTHVTNVKAKAESKSDEDTIGGSKGSVAACVYTVYPEVENPKDWKKRKDGKEYSTKCKGTSPDCLEVVPISRLEGRQIITSVCGTKATTKSPNVKFKKNADDMRSMTRAEGEAQLAALEAQLASCTEAFSAKECTKQQKALDEGNEIAAQANASSGGDKKDDDNTVIIIVVVLGLLVILLAFATVCFVKSKRSAGASNAGMQTRGAFDNPAYGAPQGKANPMYAAAEGTYGNAQFSGGGNTGGYMDVAPSGPGAY